MTAPGTLSRLDMVEKDNEGEKETGSDTRPLIHTSTSLRYSKYQVHNYLDDTNDNCSLCHDLLVLASRERRFYTFTPSPLSGPPPPPPPPPIAYCPPPPPPPPGCSNCIYSPHALISSGETFIAANYSGEGVSDPSRMVRIQPSRRNVFMTSHHAQAADFNEFEWLLRYATTDLWYEKPTKSSLKRMRTVEESGGEADELASSNPKPTEAQTPKVWASVALTTPTDDDIHECTVGHTADVIGAPYVRTCQQCTDEKSEALDATDLVYCLVFTSYQIHDPFAPGGSSTGGRQIYKMVKCGSREAAVAEIFHATGLNGWSLVFSCVMRVNEDVEKRGRKFKRVEDLWMLADEAEDDKESVRVFY
ncbi:uncharacterized protein EKO05_0010967 [Ascochyta rabiei]|uniref:uncharacterized protein n=1 Tax=Didymella rabiei TaxID=5454 RepID=UPI00220B3D6E|nr:uncharacterized protein EKO05_0010967 [Ascochyta rabiei]UPX20745.1 hypothetical protein EKO05_0010967 [Ascochyta rabiei]